MKRLPPVAARARPDAIGLVRIALPPGHPLARAIDARHTVAKQITSVAAILMGSGIAWLEGRHWARPVAVAAAVTISILIPAAACLRERMRDAAIDVILEGHEQLPISAVQRQRSRLRSARTRRGLARSFREIVEEASQPRKLQMRGARPLYHLPVVARVSTELVELVRLLETTSVSTIGAARVERLITDAMSPLYGSSSAELAAELHRIIDQNRD
jgi:hypothetical protein